MRSSPCIRATRGFTLFEVLAAVLILGLFYTVLAEAAIRGLRSEGMDRRRAAAAAIADLRLVELETALGAGVPLEPFVEEGEAEEDEAFTVTTEIAVEDLAALLPPPPPEAPEPPADLESLLVDERGQSRLYRLRVLVGWEEAGQPQQVVRQSWEFDRSVLAGLFPEEGGEGEAGGGAAAGGGEESGEGERGGRDREDRRRRGQRGSPQADPPSSSCPACDNPQTMEDMIECMRCL